MTKLLRGQFKSLLCRLQELRVSEKKRGQEMHVEVVHFLAKFDFKLALAICGWKSANFHFCKIYNMYLFPTFIL